MTMFDLLAMEPAKAAPIPERNPWCKVSPMALLRRGRSGLTAALVFIVIWGMTTHGKYSVTGDEPHYLIVSESLWSDGDFDLRDEYRSGISGVFGHDDLAMGAVMRGET